MSENAFKNLISPAVVERIADAIHAYAPEFNRNRFKKLSRELEERELKQRVLLITAKLKEELPSDFKQSAGILSKVLRQKKLKGFELWPISEYISQFGLELFDESMDLMYHLTQSFTSEFAIRPFLLQDPERTLKKLEGWILDENVHIRRWISEGTRPILPWGGKIPAFINEPRTLHLLDQLKYDDELYVRKSIANHLNDISKNHPKLVIRTLKAWEQGAPAEHRSKILWIKKQALRTLIKKGDFDALSLMGASPGVEVSLSKLKLSKRDFKLGESLEFEFVLESQAKKSQRLIVDYLIGFIKANGQVSAKVFKLKDVHLEAGGKVILRKAHSLKRITTMTFYPGRHELQIQVNGKVLKKVSWTFDL